MGNYTVDEVMVVEALRVFHAAYAAARMGSPRRAGATYAAVHAVLQFATLRRQAESDGDFKNFHRLLCERFGYTHDEKDWKRDQLSLIEWIARQQAGRVDEDARDAVAKAIADVIGHGMREKCYAHADAVLTALAQNTQVDGEPVAVVWIGRASSEGTQAYGFDRLPAFERLPPGRHPLYLHAERARVPEGMVLVPREPTPEMAATFGSMGTLGFRDCYTAMLAAAPSAPQADRRTNYVSGSVDSTGRFQPTQQGDTSAPQGGKGDG